jgi:hypothetical protein
MPDLGRHETEWAIESAWYWVCRYYTDQGADIQFFIGDPNRKTELSDLYCIIKCNEIMPAGREVGDKLEICTVEIDYRVSKQATNSATLRNRSIADFRRTTQDASLASWLEAGMESRGGITSTTVDPLTVYHALYQPENVQYVDSSDRYYHGRAAIVQTVVGD